MSGCTACDRDLCGQRPWRIAWAERENERRQRAYRDATDSWQRRDDHLARLRIEAASFLGCTQPRTGLPVELDDDELVFRVLPVARLVEAEARHIPDCPPRAASVPSPRPPAMRCRRACASSTPAWRS
ncbi:hypothetical protein NKG94_28430 [Micromonospora sp. M12]